MTLALLFLCSFQIDLSDIQFEHQDLHQHSSSGYIQLKWSGDVTGSYILQQSADKNFIQPSIIYQGLDQASFISGLKDGVYYYRIGDKSGHWSSTLTLTVEHQSMQLAYTLFTLGFLVFVMTVGVIVQGIRSQTK